MGSFNRQLLGKARCIRVLAALLIFAAHVSTAHATGESILLPGYVRLNNGATTIGLKAPPPILPGWGIQSPGFTPVPNPSGLKLIVDNSWPDLPGYRLIRLEILANQPAPNQPASEERRLRVQIKLINSGRGEMNVTTEEIVLPAGQSAVKYQLYYPSHGQQRIHEIRTTEDEETWPDLSCRIPTSHTSTGTLAYLDLTPLQPKTTLLSGNVSIPGAVGISTTAAVSGQSEIHEYRSGETFSYALNVGWSGISNYAELPLNPLGYGCFRVVFCRAEQLETLRADYPQQWAALRSWVATGGKLLVGPKQNNTAESTRQTLLKLDRLFPLGEATGSETPHAAWRTPKISSIAEQLQFQQNNSYGYDGSYGIPGPQQPPSFNMPNGNFGGQANTSYPERDWFQGTVVVIPDEQRIDAIFAHLHNVTQQPLPATRLPKVGLPPITMFQVLITLFVILIGPVNYFYFKKKKKMNWLLITVPAGALAITSLLLAYTLLKDGIGVRTWSQSYTILDQVQQSAATRQQFCLFAGITPGDGLRYRSETNFNDLSELLFSNRFGNRYRDVKNWDYAWNPPTDGSSNVSEQHLRSGWLPARTLKLFETREYESCQRRLQLQISGDTCQLVNKLGSKVLGVYIAEGDRVWEASVIDKDGSVSAGLVNEAKALELKTTLDQALYLPTPGFDLSDRSPLPPQSATINERFLGLRRLHPRVYLAVVENWPDLQSGVPNPTIESWGPHVILGVW